MSFDVDAWEDALDRRRVLLLDEHSPVAIKRDVREFELACEPLRFAQAFAEVMAEPGRHFDLISVMRKRCNVGQPFVLGERFQGRFSLARAVGEQREAKQRGVRSRRFWQGAEHWLERGAARDVVRRLEDAFTSDFGEITRLRIDALPAELEYVYLEGSYIAGSSTFRVEAREPGRCVVTQIWLYQEIHPRYVKWVGTDVLRRHLAVVFSQVWQACARAGGQVLSCDVPEAYRGVSLQRRESAAALPLREMKRVPLT